MTPFMDAESGQTKCNGRAARSVGSGGVRLKRSGSWHAVKAQRQRCFPMGPWRLARRSPNDRWTPPRHQLQHAPGLQTSSRWTATAMTIQKRSVKRSARIARGQRAPNELRAAARNMRRGYSRVRSVLCVDNHPGWLNIASRVGGEANCDPPMLFRPHFTQMRAFSKILMVRWELYGLGGSPVVNCVAGVKNFAHRTK